MSLGLGLVELVRRATATEVNSNAGGPFDARGQPTRSDMTMTCVGLELHLQGGNAAPVGVQAPLKT